MFFSFRYPPPRWHSSAYHKQIPRVVDYNFLEGTAPNRSIYAPRSAGNTFMYAACIFFFSPLLVYFLCMTSSSLPFVTHIRGHMACTPLPSPLPRACLRFSRENKKIKGFFPWRPLASNWWEFMQPASIITARRLRGAFVVSSYTDAFVLGFDLNPNEHIIILLIIYLLCIFTCNIVSIYIHNICLLYTSDAADE